MEEPLPSSAEEEELAVFPDLDRLHSAPPRSPPLCPELSPSSVEELPPSCAEEEELAIFPDLDRLHSAPATLASALPRAMAVVCGGAAAVVCGGGGARRLP
jgi:hypothetical protein